MDVGTGGGFPGMPLAICNPDVDFTLVDSIRKKVMVVDDAVKRLNLRNVEPVCMRVEELRGLCDFVVARSVTNMPQFIQWVAKNLRAGPLSAADSDISHVLGEGGVLYIGPSGLDELRAMGVEPAGVFPVQEVLTTGNTPEYESDKEIYYFRTSDILSAVGARPPSRETARRRRGRRT
mmetsp:Transcript_39293/g.112150  ORF Transcript_39293/g.112150 Transcript_39293/m.112150 type:complete len:178 (+) Transcript_39293:1-534(+)